MIEKIIGYRKGACIVHFSRWALEQAGGAVRKLSACRQGQEGQNQYEGYAFDGAKLAINFTFLKITYNSLHSISQSTLT